MIQALVLIFLEKIVFVLPRLSQRLERFYKCVVEETLIGKDPDVAEDFAGSDLSIEKILRQRQRVEICGAWKTSSSFYWSYFLKNILQIIAGTGFLAADVTYIMNSSDELGFCKIPMGIERENMVTLQCRQKRYDVNQTLMIIFSSFLALTILLDALALLWWWEGSGLRTITKILKTLKGKKEEDLVKADGKDFVFLFDLIAHNCGVPATLRVLTHTAPRFKQFCQPKLRIDSLWMNESSLSISWEPPQLQEIDETQVQHINLQKYVATILPKIKDNFLDIEPHANNNTAKFEELEGGTREYIITVSAIIGDAKMKGATYRTCLPPHPPQNLRISQETSQENEGSKLRVSWIKPKGKFDKFLLFVDNISSRNGSQVAVMNQEVINQQIEVSIHDHEKSEYIVQNLNPGDAYEVKLRTVSGRIPCLQCPREVFISEPKPPTTEDIKIQLGNDQVSVYWQPPRKGGGHNTLEGYEIELRNSAGNEMFKEPLNLNTFRHSFNDIFPGQEYTIALASICRLRNVENRILMSKKSVQTFKTFMSLPSPPTNLLLDKSEPTAMKLHWDYQGVGSVEATFPITVTLLDDNEEFYQSDRKAENTTIKLASLPHSGAIYEIQLQSMIIHNSEPLYSSPVKGLFVTKPYPPSDLQIVDMDLQIFRWTKSSTTKVQHYKFKIKGTDRSQDFIVSDQQGDTILFTLETEIETGVEYNINITSQVYLNDGWQESNSLLLKLVKEYADSSFNSTVDDQDEIDGECKKKRLYLIDPKSNLENFMPKLVERASVKAAISRNPSGMSRKPSGIKKK